MGVRFCWAFLCAIYVWFILVGMLLSSFMISGFMMKHVAKQPVDVEEMLNFDYTMASPVAVVPLSSFTGLGNKLQLTVSLTMPESEYNRNLGVFQRRVVLDTIGSCVDFLPGYFDQGYETKKDLMIKRMFMERMVFFKEIK
ncbi:hypothetical protein L1887_39607 [Cichorium endivia]|nr:hypothetical protein L1887_39607 [Cichorium endivia]